MNRLLFSDDQFSGINHMFEEETRPQAMQFNRSVTHEPPSCGRCATRNLGHIEIRLEPGCCRK